MAHPSILEKPSETKTPRRFTRQRFEALVYADLGFENGGFPINISADGMAFQGIRPLEIDQTICVTFKLREISESLTVTAKIVWLTDSRKGGGLRFIDLQEDSQRLINDWISLQRRGAGPKENPTATGPRVEAKGLASAPAILLVPDQGDSPAQMSTNVATPLPSSLAPTQAAQTITPQVTSKPKSDFKKNHSIQDSQRAADLARSIRIPTLLAGNEQKRSWIRSYGLGLAASIAMIVVSGVLLWPLRGALLALVTSDNPEQTEIQPASASTAEITPEMNTATEPASDPTIFESLPLAPITNVQENLTLPFPPDAPMSAPNHPAAIPAQPVPQINHGKPSKIPALSADAMRPARPAIVPAQRVPSVAVQPKAISEGTNELPGGGTTAAKMSSPAIKPPETFESATGSIEIISDPYPSIRVPAEWKERALRPGTLFQIGHLVSKVEPLYPQEALQHRIAGTAKVHVVIGRSGMVERAERLDGPELLAQAALRAIQQWHYEPTILGGTAIEVEEDITIAFRITPPVPAAN